MNRIRDFLVFLMSALGWVWFAFTWGFPVLLLLIGRFLVSSMNQPVVGGLFGLVVPGNILWPLIVLGLLGFMWLGLESFTAAYRLTPMRTLFANFFVAVFWTVILIGSACISTGEGNLQWWQVLPPAFALADLMLGTALALNNAVQKPIVQQQQGTT